MSDHGTDPLTPARFITQASLFEPRLITALSAWIEHIPLAGWLIEATRPRKFVELGTHSGVSYFAFCEAVLRLGLSTECYAVDHWRGDDHSGLYGEEVYRSVKKVNASYESFSHLLRATFDEGAEEFKEGSIDLLHIDGLHTYEAVVHDFETWLPRMSHRGVVLFHDTNERKADFGVYKLFAELAERYPSFEFRHGHGLGIVAVGPEVPRGLHYIVNLDPASDDARLLREAYKALGARFAARVEAAKLNSEVSSLSEAIESRDREIEGHNDEVTRLKERRSSELERLSLTISQVSQLTEALTTKTQQIERLRASIAKSSSRSSELSLALARSQQRVNNLETSTAWKITRPLRYASDVVKRFVRQFRTSKAHDPKRATPRSKTDYLYDAFDHGLDVATREELRVHLAENPHLENTLVSVVLPTRDRAPVISTAIKSVLDQVHDKWELLVIDDGSTDATEKVMGEFSDDDRITYVRTDPQGVGAARNTGLSLSRGDIIAYLDSDNTWDTEFLSLMIAGIDRDGADVAYSAVKVVQGEEVAGYRGDFFSYEACLKANYIDINALCHRREPIDEGLAFEPRIRRTNDWDMILGLTLGREVSYVPFVGVSYSLGRDDRISVIEPFVFRHIVEARHRARLGTGAPLASFDDVVVGLKLSIAIRIAAPVDKRDSWGDHHFAVGLGQAFERLGHTATVYYREDDVKPLRHDVVVVLRGLDRFEPVPQAVNVLWSISHPDLVSHNEMRSYNLVAVASDSYRRMLTHTLGKDVLCMRQATDRARFFPQPILDHDERLLFVGNSRKVKRPSVQMAIETGLPLVIYGSGWEGIAPQEAIKGHYLPNECATYAYARAAAVLNDHWDSMKDFGYISNRVYDALASGAHVISDYFPELEREYGDVVSMFRDKGDFVEAAKAALSRDRDGETSSTAVEIINHHSFDARAVALLRAIRGFLGAEETEPTNTGSDAKTFTGPARERPVRVGILPQMPDGTNWSSSAYIRLLLPLTSDLQGPIPELTVIAPDEASELGGLEGLDCLIVSRTAVKTASVANKVASNVARLGIPMIVDTDDAFHLMDESHPQYHEYTPQVEALDALIERAAEIWCSTGPLKAAVDERFGLSSVLVPNSIDPRLWRRYRNRDQQARSHDRRELLYFGTATHGPDLAMILPVLEEQASLNPDAFRLYVVGVAQDLPDRPWVERMEPPHPSTYPGFSRWMRDRAGEFDLAIAPLVDTSFNRLKSDIKVLEYTAMGLPAVVSDLDPYQGVDWADRCSSVDDWRLILSELIADRFAVEDRRMRVEAHEEDIWRNRRAAQTGEVLMSRIRSLVNG